MLGHLQAMHGMRPNFRSRDSVSLATVVQPNVGELDLFSHLHDTLSEHPRGGDITARQRALYGEIESRVAA